MRKAFLLAFVPAVWLAGSTPATTEPNPDEIIQKFASKEGEFLKARSNYTYRQTVRIQELDESGSVRGRHEMVSDIIFTPGGERIERVVHAPVATLQNLQLTPQDEQDLRDVQPFVLTTENLADYHIRYLGREKVDEIPAFSFAVKPKKLEPGKRYFEGVVWVDDRDLQIVKTYGKGVGLIKKGSDNQFPKFETYREQIDGKYWFPTYTIADDTLHFQTGPQKIRMIVKYENYKQFKPESTIKFGEVVGEGATPEQKAAPEQKTAPEQKK
jgi:hypothetical protein